MMWLMDHVFKYTNFGLVSLIHGDFFIRQVRPKGRSPLTSCEVFVDVSVIRPLANSACHCRDDTARIQCRRYKTDDFSSRVSPPRSSPEGFSVTSVIGPFYAASPSTHLLVPAGQQTRLWDSSGRGRPLRRRTALDSSVGGPLSPAGSD